GMSASRSPIYTNVGDFSVLTSTMRSQVDGGFPIPGAPVTFTTTLGTLGPNDGGPSTGATYSDTTNAAGQVFARLHAGTLAGTASVSSTGYGASAGATVQITDLSQIAFVSSACGTQSPCTLMGIRGSGRNETATLTFQVTAMGGGGASNIPVTFSLGSGAPLGATVSPGGVTDATGRVQAIVQSGSGIGVLSVNALVYPPIQTSSPGIGITGARVSNAGISILCEAVNVPAYISPTPPRDITVNCSVRLTDRYTNAIGFPTTVNFVAEAGTVSTSVITAPFNFNNPSDPNIGRASFTFSTRAGTGRALPVDVTPLASAPGQDPSPRSPEPSYPSGSLTLNPRDGLLTVVAYVNGEEYFNDSNGNGAYNFGEQFYDQGERLVDADDDGAWALGESFFDENNNGVWDGPDGLYQSDKQVWTEYRLLYTDLPFNGLLVPNPFSGPCLPPDAGTPAPDAGLPLAKGTFVNLDIFASDRHLNIPSAGTAFTITHTANKGSVRLNGGTTLLDSYGFGIDRVLVNAPDGGSPSQLLCRPVDPVCYFKVQFYNWSGGQIGTTATVTGAPITDSQPCQPDTVTVTATELTIPTGFISTGAIE
ncbi:MAG TPA: hypothetical protein VFB81_20645, partial [Myxococcales bacterium]|nr:hypothetical protein [Myxococcales bacterium]